MSSLKTGTLSKTDNSQEKVRITERQKRNYIDALQRGASAETINRYGRANGVHQRSLNDPNQKRSLKDIHQYKLNSKDYKRNLKQQAGFAAEVKITAQKNTEAIIEGREPDTYRTDDLGRVNDQNTDIVSGGQNYQVKFVGNNARDLVKKLKSNKYEKYYTSGNKILIASDHYDEVQQIFKDQIKTLEQQLSSNKFQKNDPQNLKLEKEIAKLKKIKQSLCKADLTEQEAIFARLHPNLSVAQDMIKTSHKAGVSQMKISAALSAGISITRNIFAYANQEKTADEAAKDVVRDIGMGTVKGYARAFSGSLVEGFVQGSGNSQLAKLSQTAGVSASLGLGLLDVSTIMSHYIRGEITGEECVNEICQNSLATIVSTTSATLASKKALTVTSSKFIGDLAGASAGFIGYAAVSAIYGEIEAALKNAALARSERIRIEKECNEAIQMIHQYQEQIIEVAQRYFIKNYQRINSIFKNINRAIYDSDVDSFIQQNVKLQELFGANVQFRSKDEFDLLMNNNRPFEF